MMRKPLSIALAIALDYALRLVMDHVKGAVMIVVAVDAKAVVLKHVALVVEMDVAMDAVIVAKDHAVPTAL